MFKLLWKLLRFLPPGFLTFIKHRTSAQFRYWLRQKFGADYRDIPDEIITIADGRKFHLSSDPVYWGLYYGLGYEPEVTGILIKLLRPNDVIFDIGANFGWYATTFAYELGQETQVYAFEPVPQTYERLCEHVQLNRLENRISAQRIALSDHSGTTQIHVVKGRSHALASLSPQGEDDFDSFDTPLETLDSFLEKEQINHINFSKIDVEGNELMVLKGAGNILASPDAPILMVEINNDTFAPFGYTAEAIWSQLKDYGYDCFYGMLDAETLAPIENVQDFMDIANVVMVRNRHESSMDDASLWANFKAVPGMVICGKSNVISPRLKDSGISLNSQVFTH